MATQSDFDALLRRDYEASIFRLGEDWRPIIARDNQAARRRRTIQAPNGARVVLPAKSDFMERIAKWLFAPVVVPLREEDAEVAKIFEQLLEFSARELLAYQPDTPLYKEDTPFRPTCAMYRNEPIVAPKDVYRDITVV